MKSIAICASISFYKQVVEIKNKLESLGLAVLIPELAKQMEDTSNFDVNFHQEKFYGEDVATSRASAIKNHFKKIEASDAILVVNQQKHGINGYIGPNVLMEMGLAFHLGKQIFVLSDYRENKQFSDELETLKPIQLKLDLRHLFETLAINKLGS